MEEKIKTILDGIDSIEEKTKNTECSTEFRNGQNRVYTLVRELIYQQFPELKESEDERIRKWLSDILDTSNWRNDWPYTKQQVINYLEKQKEQQPALRITKDFYEPDGPQFDIVDQNPAEWSEEDDVMLDKVLCLISPGTTLTEDNADYCVELKQWIVSLRERILNPSVPQPHWKPSKEQMGALNYAYCELFKRRDVGDNILSPLQTLIDTLSKL